MRKTTTVKDTRDPVFDENVQYKDVAISTIQTKDLEVSIIDRKVIFPKHQSLIGKISISLSTLGVSNVETTDWYILVK